MEKPIESVPKHEKRRYLRELSGLTQREVGERAGISQSSLSKFEHGHKSLPPDKLAKLDAVLDDAIQHRHVELGPHATTISEKSPHNLRLSPREFVDRKDIELGEQGRGRRAFLRFAADAGWAVVAAALIELFKPLVSLVYDPEADQEMLGRLFGAAGQDGTGALVAAADHPFKRPPKGSDWYPTEVRNCTSYKTRFLDKCVLRQVRHDPDIMPIDGLVLFGSQVSNYKTRQYFGNWLNEKPHLSIRTNQWRVRLHWNLYTPDSAQTMERWQFGAVWKSWHHRFAGPHGEEFMSIEEKGELRDDYLLVTALPLSGQGKQRIIVFAGLHGPGQKAANILLCDPPLRQLRNLEKKIGGSPFYQALFHVPLQKDDIGEFSPKDIELLEAKQLEPAFS